MNWYKLSKLEKDWYKTWIYHISEVIKHFFNPSSQSLMPYTKENMGKDILTRYTSNSPELIDIEYNIDQLKIFITYSSYFYIVELMSEGKELTINIFSYSGIDFLQYNKPVNIKLILDSPDVNPYSIISEIKKFLINDADKKYIQESKLIFKN